MSTAHAHLDVEESDIVVTGSDQLHERSARRFFLIVLGAHQTIDGWRVPTRGNRPHDIVVRINNFLTSGGFNTTRGEIAERSVELALERQRSIERAKIAASTWRKGHSFIEDDQVSVQLDRLGWKPERTLYNHQLRNIGHALAAINQANFSVPGAGKTATTLAIALIHFEAKTIDTIVVVGPLASFKPWELETRAAIGPRFTIYRIMGPTRKRRDFYSGISRGNLLLMSYATAASDRLAIIEMCKRLNVMLVIDESHRIKRFKGGVWAPALTEIAEFARVRIILSGTPMPNSALDLYSQLNVLWPGGLLTGTKPDFANQAERSFSNIISKILPFATRTAKSELGLKPYKIRYYTAEMLDLQADIYRLIADRLRTHIKNANTWKDKIAILRRARPVRLLQAATNPDLLNYKDDHLILPQMESFNPTIMERLARFNETDLPIKSLVALDIIQSIVADDGKVVCWSNFLRNLDDFSRLVRERLGLPVFQVDGRVLAGDDPRYEQTRVVVKEDDTRESRIEEFLMFDGPAVLVTNPATCSESISLHQACHHAIYLDRTYDAALFLQSIDRIHRLGLGPEIDVTIHIIQASINGEDTIDHLVDFSIQAKKANMEQLLEGAEVRPLRQDLSDAEGTLYDIEDILRYLIGEDTDEEL